MTSRTLSLNLFKGECKRRLWLYALTLVVFIALQPGALLMDIDRWLMWGIRPAMMIANIKGTVAISYIGILFMILAVIYATVCYGYIFSRSRVDMYHSLPMNRNELFVVNYLSGLLPFMAIELMVSLLQMCVVLIKGLGGHGIGNVIFSTYIYSVFLFMLAYSITILALSLCGNPVIGLMLSGAVMLGYEFTEMIISWYSNFCFQTHSYISSEDYPLWKLVLSPSSFENRLGNTIGDTPVRFMVLIAVTVIYTLLAAFLYRIRPSESAGKAVCYKILQPIIRMPLVVIAALSGGIYLVFVSGDVMTAGWYWMLFAFAGILTHVVAEIVLQLDFKKAIRHWQQLIISLAVAAVIACFFLYDIGGYDRYIPKDNKVSSAAIALSDIDMDISSFEFTGRGAGEDIEYIDRTAYILREMKSENNTAIRQLASLGVASIDPERSVFKRIEKQRRQEMTYDGVYYSQKISSESSEDNRKLSYTIRYDLTNGRTVYRTYAASLSEAYAPAEAIYDSAEYKEASYQIDEMIGKGLFDKVTLTDSFYDEVFKLSGDDIDTFLTELDKDMKSMTLKRIVDEYPIYQVTGIMKDSEMMGYYNDMLYGYYIYPDYTNTIAFLKSRGANVDTVQRLAPDRIDHVEITDYSRANDPVILYEDIDAKASQQFVEPVKVMYNEDEDKAIIKEINDIAVYDHFCYVNSIFKPYEENLDINIFYQTDNGFLNSVYVRIPKGKLPEKVRDDIEKAYEEGDYANNGEIYATSTIID